MKTAKKNDNDNNNNAAEPGAVSATTAPTPS
jgi:hypothetical protein